MKLIDTYTTRGVIQTDKSVNKVNVFDGSYKTGYKLTRISIAQKDIDREAGVYGVAFKVMTTETPVEDAASWNWADNQEIGWSYWCHDANFISPMTFEDVDRTNLIVEDCYITAFTSNGANIKLNYMLEFEKYELPAMRGSLAIVQNRSQG